MFSYRTLIALVAVGFLAKGAWAGPAAAPGLTNDGLIHAEDPYCNTDDGVALSDKNGCRPFDQTERVCWTAPSLNPPSSPLRVCLLSFSIPGSDGSRTASFSLDGRPEITILSHLEDDPKGRLPYKYGVIDLVPKGQAAVSWGCIAYKVQLRWAADSLTARDVDATRLELVIRRQDIRSGEFSCPSDAVIDDVLRHADAEQVYWQDAH